MFFIDYAIIALFSIILIILCLKIEHKRLVISFLIGFGISILSFRAFIEFIFSPQGNILCPLLALFYISTIAFLILWNLKKSKLVYVLLSVPIICVGAGIALIEYQRYIDRIPVVNDEQNIFLLYRYEPFRKDNLLVKLGGESNLKIRENLPILDGATALCPVYASFVQEVYPEGDYHFLKSPVFCNGTDNAYDNLLAGKADIIFCAQPSEAQLKQFHDKGIKLNLTAIGREAFVFFVNKRNPINDLSIEDIKGIYSGRIKNWKELNGENQNIRAFQRSENSGSQTMLEKIMEGTLIEEPRRENIRADMGGIIN
ncbi:MAG: substrate-binding domain-containing protein, partial [Spirochaetaceae bacterium]|nr:substrate-binding domain-containing protein [Spirochaetaceae bacterium]